MADTGEISGIISSVLLIIYVFISAAEDIKCREISLKLSVIFTISGIILGFMGKRELLSLITALLPGAVILLMSMLTGGAIGVGDAIFAATCAVYLEAGELVLCVACAWIMCALTALVMIAGTLITARSAVKHRGLPFAAYMLPPVLMTVLYKMM